MPPKKKTSAKKSKKPAKAPIKKTPTKKPVSQLKNVKQVVTVNVQSGSSSTKRQSPQKSSNEAVRPAIRTYDVLQARATGMREQGSDNLGLIADLSAIRKKLENLDNTHRLTNISKDEYKLPPEWYEPPASKDAGKNHDRELRLKDQHLKRISETGGFMDRADSVTGTAFSLPDSDSEEPFNRNRRWFADDNSVYSGDSMGTRPPSSVASSRGPTKDASHLMGPIFEESDESASQASTVKSPHPTPPKKDSKASSSSNQGSGPGGRGGLAVKGKRGFQPKNTSPPQPPGSPGNFGRAV